MFVSYSFIYMFLLFNLLLNSWYLDTVS